MSRPVTIAVLLLLVLRTSTAAAAPTDEERARAQQHYDEGIHRYRQADYSGAVAEFQAAYDIAAYPVILYNLALSFDKLGRPALAVERMKKVLEAPGTLPPQRIERARKLVAERSAELVTLEVDSNVPGASIFVGGVKRGTAPATLLVPAGVISVQVWHANHLPFSREVTGGQGSRVRVEANLEPTDQRPAQLSIESPLPDVEIVVDDTTRGRTPLSAPILLAPGSHQVVLRRPGYRESSHDVALVAGQRLSLPASLELAPAALRQGGSLALELPASGAVVSVDGERQGSDQGSIALPAGRHALDVELGGYYPAHRDVVVAAGEQLKLRVEMDPLPDTLARHHESVATFRKAGWATVGVGTAFAIAGAIGLGANRANHRRWDELEAAHAQCLKDQMTQQGVDCAPVSRELGQKRTDTKTIDAVAAVGVIAGGLGIAAGITVLLLGPDADRYERAPSEPLAWRPWLSIGRTSTVGVSGSF